VTGFSAAVRTTIRQRADGYCEVCGRARGAEAHHRRPRGMGGTNREDTNTASAGLFLCRDCHRLIESYRNVAEVLGWLVPQNQPPADIPVMYRGAWVFLDELGNLQPIEEVI
jgi:5-methylcytosine-specific restriction protein A